MAEADLSYAGGMVLFLLTAAALSFVSSAAFRRCQWERWSFAAFIAALTCCWYCLSIGFVLLNRISLGSVSQRLSYPATVTFIHMCIKGLAAMLYMGVANRQAIYATATRLRLSYPRAFASWLSTTLKLSGSVWLRHILPLGVITALDIFLSNLSLRHVEMSLYSVAKSSALVFTFALSLLLGLLRRPSPLLTLAVAGVFVGVVLSALRPMPVHAGGLVAVLIAAACSGGRWALSERYFSDSGLDFPVLPLILLQAPVTAVAMLPLSAMEVAASPLLQSTDALGSLMVLGLCGGLMAFFLLIVELKLISITSALTANVLAQTKDLFAVLCAVIVLNEHLSLLNAGGVLVVTISAIAYAFLRARRALEAQPTDAPFSAEMQSPSKSLQGAGAGIATAGAIEGAAAALPAAPSSELERLEFSPELSMPPSTLKHSRRAAASAQVQARGSIDLEELSDEDEEAGGEGDRRSLIQAGGVGGSPSRRVPAPARAAAADTAP